MAYVDLWSVQGKDLLFDEFDKDVTKTEEFVKSQSERAKLMSEESNHMIEYFSVLKKAGKMIFGDSW